MTRKKTTAEIFMNRALTNSLFANTNEISPEPRNISGPNMKKILISWIKIFEMFAVSFAIIIAGSKDQPMSPANCPRMKRNVPRLSTASFYCFCMYPLRFEIPYITRDIPSTDINV